MVMALRDQLRVLADDRGTPAESNRGFEAMLLADPSKFLEDGHRGWK